MASRGTIFSFFLGSWTLGLVAQCEALLGAVEAAARGRRVFGVATELRAAEAARDAAAAEDFGAPPPPAKQRHTDIYT